MDAGGVENEVARKAEGLLGEPGRKAQVVGAVFVAQQQGGVERADYADGQRRYVESLSAYARQFLELMQKPDVDLIEGLSPAIAIEQKTTSRNPRSTVGTVPEIYDYMRLLFARIGIPIHQRRVYQLKVRALAKWLT